MGSLLRRTISAYVPLYVVATLVWWLDEKALMLRCSQRSNELSEVCDSFFSLHAARIDPRVQMSYAVLLAVPRWLVVCSKQDFMRACNISWSALIVFRGTPASVPNCRMSECTLPRLSMSP